MKTPFSQLEKPDLKVGLNLAIIISMLILSVQGTLNITDHINGMEAENTKSQNINLDIASPFQEERLYEGAVGSQSINESTRLIQSDSFSIGNGTFPGYEPANTSYLIDDVHGWQVNYVKSKISNIKDERDWIRNGHFGSAEGLTAGIIINDSYEYSPYDNKQDEDPTNWSNVHTSINGNNSDFTRLYFDEIGMEQDFDYIFLWDENNQELANFTGTAEQFWTPWYETSSVNVTVKSDNTINGFGYNITEVQFANGTMFEWNNNSWTYYAPKTNNPDLFSGESGRKNNRSGVRVSWEAYDDGGFWTYDANNMSAWTQNFTIPRGRLYDAWISMDYYMEKGISTNDLYMFFDINGMNVYSKGFRTVANQGKKQWHSTGLVNLVNWENVTNVFPSILHDNELNVTIGIRTDNTVGYGGFEDAEKQDLWLDNIQLILQTDANATQQFINLTLDGNDPIEDPEKWGVAYYNEAGLWNLDPLEIELNTSAYKLTLDIQTNITGFHLDETYDAENGVGGKRLSIKNTDEMLWEFYHLVYTPPDYENFQFTIEKPYGWNVTDVKDPTGIVTPFDYGGHLENNVAINSTYAFYPGWWYFKANSTNLINTSETYLWNKSEWIRYNNALMDEHFYDLNQIISIRSKIDARNQASTWANLTVYYPNETVWFEESTHPDSEGNILFNNFTAGAYNSSGGVYAYSVVWTNGTSAGGINGTFEVRRNFNIDFSYPRNAVSGDTLSLTYGDVVPLRIFLNDTENSEAVTNAHIIYNKSGSWMDMVEISSGIYDSSIDTLDFANPGLYEIRFNITLSGYYDQTAHLKFHLTKETDARIIYSSNIVNFKENTSFELQYTDVLEGSGVSGADISMNLTESEYSYIETSTAGTYKINVSTLTFPGLGSHEIKINVSLTNYQKKTIIHRLQIEPTLVDLGLLVNGTPVPDGDSYTGKVSQLLNLTVSVDASYNAEAITAGTIKITDYAGFEEKCLESDTGYSVMINSSDLGYGVHFLSIIFNKTNFKTSSHTLELRVERLTLNPVLSDTETTIVRELGDEFTVRIFLTDADTGVPMESAQIAYSWLYGTGVLFNEGNGYYTMSSIAPQQAGSFPVQITINNGDDYQVQSISVTIVSQNADVAARDLWWILIPIGVVLLGLMAVIIKQNVINPRKERELEHLKRKTQVFDDITNIRGLMVIEKQSGLLMYKHIISGLNEENEQLFTGFLQAIMSFSKKITTDPDLPKQRGRDTAEMVDESDALEFTHENVNILVMDGYKSRVALILEDRASDELKKMVRKFIREFEGIYKFRLKNWDGDVDAFEEMTPGLVQEIFNLEMLREYRLNDPEILPRLKKRLVSANTISQHVFKIVETLHEENGSFKLKTVISLVPGQEELKAKDVLLLFIKNNLLLPTSNND